MNGHRGALRVAVVGSGPAGCYTVGALLQACGPEIAIDLYERLATPFGLVRAGVAPDHQDKKRIVPNLFAFWLNDARVRFIGNTTVGTDVSQRELAQWYDAVVYAVGAERDATLGIPGEGLQGSWSAREFVAWYNGHPDHAGLCFDLSCERALIVGNGNVALDVVRMLMSPVERLRATDIADHALRALAASNIREVVLLGRRGPEAAAFNAAELEELGCLEDVAIDVEGDALSQGELPEGADRAARRKLEILRDLARRDRRSAGKRIVFRFFTSPVELLGTQRVERVRVTDTRPVAGQMADPARFDPRQTSIPAGLVLRAIGYRGQPVPGLPFDERWGVIENHRGRVVSQGAVMRGVYVAGWIKRGARGIIGSNKTCAAETVACLLDDHREGRLAAASMDFGDVMRILRARRDRIVSREGWFAIDAAEQRAGRALNRPRVKITDREMLLDTAAV